MTYIDINKFMWKISRWDVFLMHWNIKTEQMHYQVVLNDKINENDNIIYLSISTTKIENRKKFIETRWFFPKTLVIVYSWEVSFLSKDSCFDCNHISTYSKFDFFSDYELKKIKYKWKLPESIISKILHWVSLSKTISIKLKKEIWIL